MNPRELIAEIVEHIRGMWRYRWLAVGCAWVISVLGWAFVYSIPDVYRASAKVFVDTSSLLRPLMQGLTAVSDPMTEVQLVSRAVLSRPNIEEVAYKTDLALRAETTQQMEELVTSLQERIVVSGRDNIFTIEYEDFSRDKARDVVATVLDAFTESAISNQGTDADVTERALANEVEVHVRRLKEAEDSLARFKQDNLGYMPGEYGDYYARLQAATGSVAGTQERLRQVQERRDELKRQIEGEVPIFGIVPTTAAANCSRGTQIAELRAQLDSLSVNFTEKHPRIVTLEETIAQLEALCQAETASLAAAWPAASSGNELEVNPVYQSLRIQLTTAEVEIAELRSKAATDQSEVERLRRDVDKITEVEAQLKQLNRDYDVIQARHQELLKRWEDLQAKKRLDPVTDNVQFRRIEPPFAQADPIGPNRPLLLAAVLIGAIGGGIALAFGMNQVNPVFFTRIGLRRVVQFPVLGAISMIATPEILAQRRLARISWAATVLLLLVAGAASILFAPQLTAFVQGVLFGGVQA